MWSFSTLPPSTTVKTNCSIINYVTDGRVTIHTRYASTRNPLAIFYPTPSPRPRSTSITRSMSGINPLTRPASALRKYVRDNGLPEHFPERTVARDPVRCGTRTAGIRFRTCTISPLGPWVSGVKFATLRIVSRIYIVALRSTPMSI